MPTTTVKEKPILFSAPMVKAIIDGRKSQTRRALKPQPSWLLPDHRIEWSRCDDGTFCASDKLDLHLTGYDTLGAWPCPYGKPGDRLWVREAFWHDEPYHMDYAASCIYVADHPDDFDPRKDQFYPFVDYVKRPSIHMPRFLSRLTLEITDVRVQRIQKISHADIAAEGVLDYFDPEYSQTPYNAGVARTKFEQLWNKINGPGAWEKNYWVWAISFRKVS